GVSLGGSSWSGCEGSTSRQSTRWRGCPGGSRSRQRSRVRFNNLSDAGKRFPDLAKPSQRAQNLRLVVGQMAHDDVGVAEGGELGESFDDAFDGAGDERRGGNPAIPGREDAR